MTGALERVTDPGYIDGLAEADLDVVRQKRQECQDIENGLSYVRRLVHGRLDVVLDELAQRRAGAGPSDLASIIDRLPGLLSGGSRSDGLPRPPQDLAPDSFAESLVAELESRFPASLLGELPSLSLDELDDLGDRLAAYEQEVSGGRAALHAVIDVLHSEIIRRYRAGDASIDSLLT